MAEIREHLRNAPLKEAVIDLRTSLAEEISGERFVELKDVLAADYPKVDKTRVLETEIKLGQDTHGRATLLDSGARYTSEDGTQVAQFQTNGFSFSRLRPYTRWTEILPEALRLWHQYLEIANVEHVTRVAVRYINRIDLPVPVDFDDYFTAPPKIPEGLPQTLAAFLTRIVMVDEDTNTLANVTQSLERGLDEKSVSVILDIDTYRQGQFSTDVAELTPIFEELHTFKNRIFFGFITEQTVQKHE